MQIVKKNGNRIIVFLAAAGLILGLNYLNIVNISKDKAAASKKISKDQKFFMSRRLKWPVL